MCQLATSDFLAYLACTLDALVSQEGANSEPRVFISVEEPETERHKVQMRVGFGCGELVKLDSLCGPFDLSECVEGITEHLKVRTQVSSTKA